MTTKRSRQRRSTALAGAVLAAALVTGCGGGGTGEDRSVQPLTSVPGPTIGLAEEVPASLAFVDQSVAPSTGTVAADAGTVGVHSAPDRLYTRLGEIPAGDAVGLTGNRAGVDGEEWAEIIWADSTAWIPTSVLST
jgi:hypothetical protein